MDIRVLRYFLQVAREESFTRAAESLHVTQPALSRQLMDLEKEVGRQLLIRGKRKVTLTEDGQLLRKRAEEIVELLQKTEQELTSGNNDICGEIKIGGGPSNTILNVAVSFRNRHPMVSFDFINGDATDITERLEHGSIDFAILLEPVDKAQYEFLNLPDGSEWGLLVKKDSVYAEMERITAEEITRIPLILHKRAELQRNLARWAGVDCERLNIAATYNVLNGGPVAMVKSGLGSVLTTNSMYDDKDTGVCFKPLYPEMKNQYVLVWKRFHVFGKTSEAFLNDIKQYAGVENTDIE